MKTTRSLTETIFVFVLLTAFLSPMFGILIALMLGWPLWTSLLFGGVLARLLMVWAIKGKGPMVADGRTGGELVPRNGDKCAGMFLENLDGTPWDGKGPYVDR